MQWSESQIRSFKPFAGALIFQISLRQDYNPIRWARSHLGLNRGCCAMHLAATLPGGEDAQWLLKYANSDEYRKYAESPPLKPGDALYSTLPGPGVDSRIDLWTAWGSMEEKCRRCLASLASGNIYAIDNSFHRVFRMHGIEDSDMAVAVIGEQAEQLAKFHAASLDQLEQLACRGSKYATMLLQKRLSVAQDPEQEARCVFWSFIYCSAYNGQVNSIFTNRPFSETKMSIFQLGKCFAEAKQYNNWIDSAYACVQLCFDDESVAPRTESVQTQIAYYIHNYESAEKRARKSINVWSCGMMKQGLIYDVRHMIVKLLWDARWTWVLEWNSKATVKRLKALYNERPPPLSGAN